MPIMIIVTAKATRRTFMVNADAIESVTRLGENEGEGGSRIWFQNGDEHVDVSDSLEEIKHNINMQIIGLLKNGR